MIKKVGRNDLCPCGSGKKYKKCCMNKVISSNFNLHDSKTCEFCNALINGESLFSREIMFGSNSEKSRQLKFVYCSEDCKFASEIIENLMFTGSSFELIPHLRDEHGFSKDMLKKGINRVFDCCDDIICGALIDWEMHY